MQTMKTPKYQVLHCSADEELKAKVEYGANRNKVSQAAFIRMTLAEALREMELPTGSHCQGGEGR